MKKIIVSTLLCGLVFPIMAQNNIELDKNLLINNQNLRFQLEGESANNSTNIFSNEDYLPPRTRLDKVAGESNIFNISGLWYDPAMNGLGFNVIHASNGIFIYYYGYTKDGERLWLVSDVGPVDLIKNQSYTLDLFEGAPGNGANFLTKPTFENGVEKWGTLTMTIDSCTSGKMTLIGKDGEKIFNITKLGDIKAVTCRVGTEDNSGGNGNPVSPWRLVWADEFDGTAVDTTRWKVLNDSTYGAGNDELACIMDRPENVKVQDGLLTITALREASPRLCEKKATLNYTSGHLHTLGKFSATFGRFEVRAKVPLTPGISKGLWPAFWMRPFDSGVGEIDVMEQIGTGENETTWINSVSQTIWYDYKKTYPKQNYVYRPKDFNLYEGFHTYAVEWEAGAIRWYVDDKLTYQTTSADVSWFNEAFSRPFYLRLNLAVGGTWAGAPTAATVFPARYEIDYVRVYERSEAQK